MITRRTFAIATAAIGAGAAAHTVLPKLEEPIVDSPIGLRIVGRDRKGNILAAGPVTDCTRSDYAIEFVGDVAVLRSGRLHHWHVHHGSEVLCHTPAQPRDIATGDIIRFRSTMNFVD